MLIPNPLAEELVRFFEQNAPEANFEQIKHTIRARLGYPVEDRFFHGIHPRARSRADLTPNSENGYRARDPAFDRLVHRVFREYQAVERLFLQQFPFPSVPGPSARSLVYRRTCLDILLVLKGVRPMAEFGYTHKLPALVYPPNRMIDHPLVGYLLLREFAPLMAEGRLEDFGFRIKVGSGDLGTTEAKDGEDVGGPPALIFLVDLQSPYWKAIKEIFFVPRPAVKFGDGDLCRYLGYPDAAPLVKHNSTSKLYGSLFTIAEYSEKENPAYYTVLADNTKDIWWPRAIASFHQTYLTQCSPERSCTVCRMVRIGNHWTITRFFERCKAAAADVGVKLALYDIPHVQEDGSGSDGEETL